MARLWKIYMCTVGLRDYVRCTRNPSDACPHATHLQGRTVNSISCVDTHAAWSACGIQAIARASTRAMLCTPRGRLVCMVWASASARADAGCRQPRINLPADWRFLPVAPATRAPAPDCLSTAARPPSSAHTNSAGSLLGVLSSDKHTKRCISTSRQLDFTPPFMFYLHAPTLIHIFQFDDLILPVFYTL